VRLARHPAARSRLPLQLLGGLDRPTSGEVWLGGQRIDNLGEKALARMRREQVGFVFQAFPLDG
jgi:putative ABC transport system ATP-binding protein